MSDPASESLELSESDQPVKAGKSEVMPEAYFSDGDTRITCPQVTIAGQSVQLPQLQPSAAVHQEHREAVGRLVGTLSSVNHLASPDFLVENEPIELKMVKELSSGNQRAKKPRVLTPRIKWTEEMERSILEHVKDGIAIGRDFEKPTATDYYKRFLDNNQLPCFEGVTITKLVQHMIYMKRMYQNALEWRNKNGQGILDQDLEHGAETVKLGLVKRCPYFDELDEILGEKPRFNPPFLHHTGAICHIGANESGGQINLVYDDANVVILDPIGAHGDIDIVIDPPNAVKDDLPQKNVPKSPIKSAASALENSMVARVNLEEKRLEWVKAKDARDRMESQANLRMEQEFRQQQLNFEREKWTEEFKRKQAIDEKRLDLEKLKIAKEAELQKLKLLNELELEKLKMKRASGSLE